MCRRAAIAAFLMLLPAAGADDLPPGILLLSRIKHHVRSELGQLPDYTCLQTVQRFRRAPGEKHLPVKPSDTVVLEVLYAGDKELYGSPGARNFANEDPSSFTGGGMSGTGIFGLHLKTVFVNDVAMFQYRGEEELAGRRAVRYDYRVPLMLSGFTIHLADGAGRVASNGSFWADPDSLDLLRLEVHADDIPSSLPLISAVQSIDYARTRIGDRQVMLPQSAVMEMLQISGEESRNLLEFTHCRSFAAESSISFDAPLPPGAVPTPTSRSGEPVPLPAGLTVSIELAAPLTERDAIGSLIEARVSGNVTEKGKILVAAGAAVRGRIRRLERYADRGDYFIVGLEFTEIETPGGTTRFYANLQDLDESSRVKLILVRAGPATPQGPARTEQIWANYLPGVASFFVVGSRLDVPKGFRTVWKTKSAR